MKISYSVLALLAAGFLGHGAFGSPMDDNVAPPRLAVTQDGHGYYHFLYFQTNVAMDAATSIALSTTSGGVVSSPMPLREGTLPDDGQTRFVIGTNQHGQSEAAYIPVTSHFAQANQ